MEPTVVIVPGLRDHVPDHWQTLLAARLPNARTVPRMTPASATKLSCDAWVDMLDCSLATIDAPVVLVAHSAGAVIVAHWAKRHRRAITGALLATPADVERPLGAGYPTTETLEHNGWLPIPREPLPFPSIVAASSNDPLGGF
ncbi:MAG TPA: alpha/beta fold hydrolase, partial [Polyangia bacterium]